MEEKKLDYRIGDRIQKTERRSSDDRVYPGEKGFISATSEIGSMTAYWDKSVELAITDKQQIRLIPPEEEFKLFNRVSCLQLGDSQAEWDRHCEENAQLISSMEGFAEQKGCIWTVKRTFLDAAHELRSAQFELVEGGSLLALIDSCDVKNGLDVGYSSKRPANAQSMMIIAYGQGYHSPEHGDGIVKELIECRLVRKSTSELYREKIDEGMSTRGGHLAHAFFAIHQHEPLKQCVRDCQSITGEIKRSPDLER